MKSEIDIYVINKVKQIRRAKGVSQAALAYEMEISPSYIGKIESPNSDSAYNVKHLNLIAKVLKCSPQDFLPVKPI